MIQLIAKTELVLERDSLIQEKEKLYVELKNILARQPGPEVAEQLAVYGENLKAKKRQMKAMQSELMMYKQQVTEYRGDLAQIRDSFAILQEKYFDQVRNRMNYIDPSTGRQNMQNTEYAGEEHQDGMRYDVHGGVQSVTPYYESPQPPTPTVESKYADTGAKEEKSAVGRAQ